MPQFFLNSTETKSGRYLITGEDYHHLVHVRRVKENDTLILRDEKGRSIRSVIRHISGTGIEAEPVSMDKCRDPGTRLILCASILKGKKFDFVIQKAVELGVTGIVPVISERSIPRVEEKSESRIRRWRKIACEAAKQSRTPVKTAVDDIIGFRSLLEMRVKGTSLIADPGSKNGIRSCLDKLKKGVPERTVRLLVGPEGGFSSGETEAAERAGWTRVSFRGNQLRAETASLVLSSIILYELGAESDNNT